MMSFYRLMVLSLIVLTMGYGTAVAQVRQGGFDRELFDRFVSMRTGDGTPIFWYFNGTVKSYPSGELLAIMEGVDLGVLVRKPNEPDTAYQLSRKIYIYRDPVTNEIIEEIDGKPVSAVQYPYQLMAYTLEGDRLVAMVEQGRQPNIQSIGPITDVSARWIGDGVAQFSSPVFLDYTLPGRGRVQSFENYDFFIQPDSVDRASRFQLSWVGYSAAPPFNNGEPTIKHMVGWRTDSFDSLPESIKSYISEKAPMWKAPPMDFTDIEALQAPQKSMR